MYPKLVWYSFLLCFMLFFITKIPWVWPEVFWIVYENSAEDRKKPRSFWRSKGDMVLGSLCQKTFKKMSKKKLTENKSENFQKWVTLSYHKTKYLQFSPIFLNFLNFFLENNCFSIWQLIGSLQRYIWWIRS